MKNKPQFLDVLSARDRITGSAIITPVLSDTALDISGGNKIFLKCENFQRAGAFKIRGAWNAMAKISDMEKSRGVITYSSGNHGQAIALCGKMLGISTTVVMPKNAPINKRLATTNFGANIHSYDPNSEKREDVTGELIAKYGFKLIPPFDHPDIIAGQGTCALELIDSVGHLDFLLIPCGGGGLLSGSAISSHELLPTCKVIGVEPELADDAARSFRSGIIETIHNPNTIADGTRTESLGEIPFTLIQSFVSDIVTVSEEAIVDAVRYAFNKLKLVVEPSGALGLAALLSGTLPLSGRIGIIISGGNIDPQMLNDCINDN
ncbi:MAG: pyridoxal-5'-phosphate-dependent protein [Acidiferrobacteraceae bacterium]|nr:pyridoxal-5'-phosphate-dependent protein [Acidiferrobacteraceae bacterium]|tara:strand:- start:82 stop:1044 length:963 start_codon:yes stop_codon:yes gene_type:complete